jgi:hypothetical protein
MKGMKLVIYSIFLNASTSWGFHAYVSFLIRTCRVAEPGLVFHRGPLA